MKTGMFGLPVDVKFCKGCVLSNQKPNPAVEFLHTSKSKKATTIIDKNGFCDGCKASKLKRKIIWKERREKLARLCDQYRSRDGSYDCIVPGSGGKDSIFASLILKRDFGMTPLTVTWSPHLYTDWGWQNHRAWINAGVDNILFSPNGRVHRLLTRLAFDNLLHPFQPFILGQKSTGPKFSILYKIPLVFYGENPAEYGSPIANFGSFIQDTKYFSPSSQKICLSGMDIKTLQKNFDISQGELQPYLPVNQRDLLSAKTVVHYLGYYLKWHPQENYYYACKHSGFQAAPERTVGSYSKYSSIDDKIDDLHYWTSYIKFGLGRATYDAVQEIWNGDISREEGISLVRQFDGEWPERFMPEICSYLSLPPSEFPDPEKSLAEPLVTKKYLQKKADSFRPHHLWKRTKAGFQLRFPIWNQ